MLNAEGRAHDLYEPSRRRSDTRLETFHVQLNSVDGLSGRFLDLILLFPGELDAKSIGVHGSPAESM
jgi:hypothetical protein